jgi:hypothetical protein
MGKQFFEVNEPLYIPLSFKVKVLALGSSHRAVIKA